MDETKALYEWEYAKQLLYTQLLRDKLQETLSDTIGLAEAADRLADEVDVFFSMRFLDYLDMVDGCTTVLIVGDGRNNYNDPRLDLYQKITRRSRRTVWQTPESPVMWGTGDSDMLEYAPDCDVILKAGS